MVSACSVLFLKAARMGVRNNWILAWIFVSREEAGDGAGALVAVEAVAGASDGCLPGAAAAVGAAGAAGAALRAWFWASRILPCTALTRVFSTPSKPGSVGAVGIPRARLIDVSIICSALAASVLLLMVVKICFFQSAMTF
jgi:hypothetical protein